MDFLAKGHGVLWSLDPWFTDERFRADWGRLALLGNDGAARLKQLGSKLIFSWREKRATGLGQLEDLTEALDRFDPAWQWRSDQELELLLTTISADLVTSLNRHVEPKVERKILLHRNLASRLMSLSSEELSSLMRKSVFFRDDSKLDELARYLAATGAQRAQLSSLSEDDLLVWLNLPELARFLPLGSALKTLAPLAKQHSKLLVAADRRQLRELALVPPCLWSSKDDFKVPPGNGFQIQVALLKSQQAPIKENCGQLHLEVLEASTKLQLKDIDQDGGHAYRRHGQQTLVGTPLRPSGVAVRVRSGLTPDGVEENANDTPKSAFASDDTQKYVVALTTAMLERELKGGGLPKTDYTYYPVVYGAGYVLTIDKATGALVEHQANKVQVVWRVKETAQNKQARTLADYYLVTLYPILETASDAN
jgi:hypothetical protein